MIISGSMAIVTGASSGIGQSFTEHLLQKGATVYGLSRNLDRMQAHKDSLGSIGAHYHPVQMDISNHDETPSTQVKLLRCDIYTLLSHYYC